MNKFSIFLGIVIVAGVVSSGYTIVHHDSKKNPLPIESKPPFPLISSPHKVNTLYYSFYGKRYAASWFIAQPRNIFLIPNFQQKNTAKEVRVAHQCRSLTNAGFYTSDSRPLGLFIADGVTRSERQTSSIANGIFWISNEGIAGITSSTPDEHIRLAIQAGPIVRKNNQSVLLSLTTDEQARRIIVATTNKSTLVFLALYDPENNYLGPLLADVPNHVSIIQEKIGETFENAINLDGGSASAFLSEESSLQELTLVGSFFCVR